jgi:hypothetical protein
MGFSLKLDLAGAKDKSVSKLLLASARQYLKEFGEVLDLVLDSAARSIAVDVLPMGETESIRVCLSGYGLTTDAAGRGWLSFEALTTSRAWLTMVAAKVLSEKKLPLPSGTPMGLLQTIL